NLSDARNAQVKIKDDLGRKILNLNDNDKKGKDKIQNEIDEIDEKIKKINKTIRVLNNEIEVFRLNQQQENRLNVVIRGINRWLKENQNLLKAINEIVPEVINENIGSIESIDKTVRVLNDESDVSELTYEQDGVIM
ncbi:hypothetical protein QB863_004883, partial [Escherichia coli]|nr:hypothetical protein [Escherichia coli]